MCEEEKTTVKHVVEPKTEVMTEAEKPLVFDLSSHRATFSPVTNLLHTHTNTPRAKICILLCPRFKSIFTPTAFGKSDTHRRIVSARSLCFSACIYMVMDAALPGIISIMQHNKGYNSIWEITLELHQQLFDT